MQAHALVAVCVLASALAADTARAQAWKDGPPPEHRLVYSSLSVFRYNPLGLLENARLTFRRRLFHDESMPLRDNFVGAGLVTQLSPAYGKVGALVEVAPASMLRLWGSFEVASHFGTFGAVQSYPTTAADFSDDTMDAREQLPAGDPRRPYATTGVHMTLGADAQAKLGPVAVRNLTRMTVNDLALRQGEDVYYDLQDDVLAPDGGVVLVNDSDVLWVSDFGLTAGARFTVVHPFYDAGQLPAGAVHDNGTLRVGPVFAYKLLEEDGARFNNPTILVLTQWWLDHRYRTGVASHPAIPYVIVGFSFTGDLLRRRPEAARTEAGD